MRVLVVARDKSGGFSSFVEEQAASLEATGVEIVRLRVRGNGIGAYLSVGREITQLASARQIDIVHAHFGLCGLAATWQSRVPTVVTFHGTDLNDWRLRVISGLAAHRAHATIVVSSALAARTRFPRPPDIIPCGIDLDAFAPIDRGRAREGLGFGDEPVVVFASSRDRGVKNFPLADEAVRSIPGARLVEVRGVSRDGVRRLLCAGDVLLMTSHTEGSPQIVKEALAVGCPVVSTDVGDVRSLIGDVEGCHITSFEVGDVAAKVTRVLTAGTRVSARHRLEPLSSAAIAVRVRAVYERVLNTARTGGTTNLADVKP